MLMTVISYGQQNHEHDHHLHHHQKFFKTIYYNQGEEIDKDELNSLMLENPATKPLWEKQKKFLTIGIISTGVMIGSASLGIILYADKQDVGYGAEVVGGIALGSTITALYFTLQSALKNNKAFCIYNEEKQVKTSFNVGPTNNGFGLSMTF